MYSKCTVIAYSQKKKSEKHWGPRRNGGGKVFKVVSAKFHQITPSWQQPKNAFGASGPLALGINCYWGGFGVGGLNITPVTLHDNILLINLN